MIRAVLLLSAVILGVCSQFLGDIGIHNGHLYGVDDIHHNHYHDLRHGLGIGRVGVAGGVGVVGGAGVVGGGIRIGRQMRLRPCQRSACTRQYIPPQCKYTPVLRDLTGMFCRGCPEDICRGPLRRGRRGGNNNKRLRRIRRRICTSTGMCTGDALGPAGMGGVGMIRGVGALGAVGLGGIRPW